MKNSLASKSPSVLVLEDDMLLAMDMQDHLTSRDCLVHGPFGRVSEAMAEIPLLDIDIAIVDLNLNGEFSFPVIESLRQRGVPVIVCSGYAELPEIKARLQGIPLLGKPWVPERLDALVGDILNTAYTMG